MSKISSPELLILGIDALIPSLVFQNLDRFPTLRRLCETGASGEYDAYCYGYGSHDNWMSLYTGLTPAQHGTIDNRCTATGGYTRSTDYEQLHPFWKVANAHGLSVGMWRPIVTAPPQSIDGYMLCGEPQTERIHGKPTMIQLDAHPSRRQILDIMEGELEIQPLPATPAERGYSWDLLRRDKQLADRVIVDAYYPEGTDYFAREMAYFTRNLIKVQSAHPVDVLFYYTATLDLIQHFQVHEQSRSQILQCMDALDAALDQLLETLRPTHVVVLSDHSTEAFGELFPDTPEPIQREAFGMRDKAVWLSNGTIVAEARNGAPLMGVHALKGTCIVQGKRVRHTAITHMRTVDFYPTLLELLELPIPEGRTGYILDILQDTRTNTTHPVLSETVVPSPPLRIALIQTNDVPTENTIINELFIDHRFAHITVFGQEKYRNVFLANQRVDAFEPIDNGEIDHRRLQQFNKVCMANPNRFSTDRTYISIRQQQDV